MGKLWIKIHLDVRPGEEEMDINACTGQRVMELMDILYSDVMKRGDTMIIRVTDDDRAYVFYQKADSKDTIPYVKVNHVFSLTRPSGRQQLLDALCNATDRIDPNIKGLIEGDIEDTRYMLEKTAYEVKEIDPKDPYVRAVNKLLKTGSDADIMAAIKSVTFFVKKIKLVEEGEDAENAE
ncbi:hypothetical protein IJI69_01390 [Candidatus Saccharibacteria bacterium]|nr:hypothetical protein [Candidatus Saccharibacteria bacterium]